MPESSRPRSHLYLGASQFLFTTEALRSGQTSRAAATLLISASGRSFELQAAGGERVRCAAAFIPPHVSRGLYAEDCGGLVSLNFDPGSPEQLGLLHVHGRAAIRPLGLRGLGALLEPIEGAMSGELPAEAMPAGARRLVHALCGLADARAVAPDARVVHVAGRLRGGAAAPLDDLAREVRLSGTRLRHLFHEQCGVSIRTYALWAKLRRGSVGMAHSQHLTEVAAEAGFADLAHMSRTFRSMFGLLPSYLVDRQRVDLRADGGAERAWRGAGVCPDTAAAAVFKTGARGSA
ncbi:helix-turn-helix transcriptional regulator [Piscinibacter sp.]|uniref:helix-turn-helix transcriptional regulator n=1 Tax=Piscinibacter sp. TaxID=1903157 RepID=UPI0039E55BEC